MAHLLKGFFHRLVAQPQIYDLVQYTLGAKKNFSAIQPYFERCAGHSVLDVGGGTGNLAALFPPAARYIWLDIDPKKLQGYRAKYPHGLGAIADVTRLPYHDKSIDYAVCRAVSHHLTDGEFSAMLEELARVLRGELIYLDGIKTNRVRSNILWYYDRGSNPRPLEDMLKIIERRFTIVDRMHYAIHHAYLLCVCQPKA